MGLVYLWLLCYFDCLGSFLLCFPPCASVTLACLAAMTIIHCSAEVKIFEVFVIFLDFQFLGTLDLGLGSVYIVGAAETWNAKMEVDEVKQTLETLK